MSEGLKLSPFYCDPIDPEYTEGLLQEDYERKTKTLELLEIQLEARRSQTFGLVPLVKQIKLLKKDIAYLKLAIHYVQTTNFD